MRLVQPTAAAASIVAGWSRSAEEAAAWCSRPEHPFPADVVGQWWTEPDVQPFLYLAADDGPIAYGELWVDPPEDEVELARLIVAPDARGRQVGRQLVMLLVEQARETGLCNVFIRVQPGNEPALRCYRAAGFVDVDPTRAAAWNAEQPQPYAWLEHLAPADVT